jgi:hypothetical protein
MAMPSPRPLAAQGFSGRAEALDAPRSRGHYAYLDLEVVKAAALLAAGILLLTA